MWYYLIMKLFLDETEQNGIQRLTVSGGKNNNNGINMQQNTSNCDSSSGISSSSATSLQRSANAFGGATINGEASNDNQHYHQLWQDDVPATNERSNGYGNGTTKSHNGKMKSDQLSNGNQTSTNSQNAYIDAFSGPGSKTSGKKFDVEESKTKKPKSLLVLNN